MSCHDGSNIFASNAYTKSPDGLISPYEELGGRYRLHNGTRYGQGLKHTHPVNFIYDDGLALADPGLYKPADIKNSLPLYDGKMQCGSCHNPHVPNPIGGFNPHFLRVSDNNGTLCISCHIK